MDLRQGFGATRQNKRQRDNDVELSQRVPTRELFAGNFLVPAPAIDPFRGQRYSAGVSSAPRLTYEYSNPQDLSLAGTVHIPGLPVEDTGYLQFNTTDLTPPPTQPAFAQQLPRQTQTSLPLSMESRLTNRFALRSHYQGLNPPQRTPGLSQSDRKQYARFDQDGRQWGGITKPATDGQKQPGEKCLTCVVNCRECDGDQLINDSCAECARRQCCCLWRDPARGLHSYKNAEAVARLERQVRVTRANMATGYDPIVALTNLGSDRAEEILKRAALELASEGVIVDNPIQNAQNLHDHLRATSNREWMNGNDQDQWAYAMLTNILNNAIGLRLGLEKAFMNGWVNDFIRRYGHGTVPYGHPN